MLIAGASTYGLTVGVVSLECRCKFKTMKISSEGLGSNPVKFSPGKLSRDTVFNVNCQVLVSTIFGIGIGCPGFFFLFQLP